MTSLPRPLHRWLSFIAAALACAGQPLLAQTYTYNYATAGAEQWDTTAKWTPAPVAYPDGVDVVARILRPDVNRTLSLNNLSLTVGELRIGDGGTGTGRWTISSGTLNLQKSTPGEKAKIYVAGATTTISAKFQATGGVEFEGANAVLITNADTRITGGVKISSNGNVYLNRASMIAGQEVELAGYGFADLGSGSVLANNTFDNDFLLSGVGGRGIFSNVGTNARLVLEGDISGSNNLILGVDNPAFNNTTELKGNNTAHSGNTDIRTHLLFHSIQNLGSGALTFSTTARTLTFAAGNTADLTKTAADAARAVALNVSTTIDTGGNDVTFANALTGTQGLVKTGVGSLALLGDNSFVGATVSAGTLVAGHDNALGSASGGLTLAAGGHLELLEGVTASVASLSLVSSASFTFHLGGDATSLLVSGNQTGDGTFLVSIAADEPLSGVYTLLSIQGSVAASAAAFELDVLSTGLGFLDWDAATGTLAFHAVPEPTTAGLLLLAAGGAVLCRRNRRG